MSRPLVPMCPPYLNAVPNPANVVTLTAAPTSAYVDQPVGTIGLYNGVAYLLTAKTSSAATWLLLESSGAAGVFTTVTATAGAITATNGNLVLGTAGNKILSTSVGTTTAAGANSFGSVTLVSGTATVATTAVTASSLIHLTRQSIGATGANPVGMLSVGTITAGTSFVINAVTTATANSNVSTDVSVVNWMIIN